MNHPLDGPGECRHELRHRLKASRGRRGERTGEHRTDVIGGSAPFRSPREWYSGKEVMEHGPQTIHIAALVGLAAGESFRACILCARIPLDRCTELRVSHCGFLGEADQLEQGTPARRGQHHALRREIPVHPPGRVGRLEASGRLEAQVQGFSL